MIGRLAGRLIFRGTDHVMIDVGGVGYVIFVNDRTAMALPRVGEAAALYTDLLVREDLLQLFGFLTPVEKEWHRLLMSVQGIGATHDHRVVIGSEQIRERVDVHNQDAHDGDARVSTTTSRSSAGTGPLFGPASALE